jgi:hypothetical protein
VTVEILGPPLRSRIAGAVTLVMARQGYPRHR